jgi:hypothetical protein
MISLPEQSMLLASTIVLYIYHECHCERLVDVCDELSQFVFVSEQYGDHDKTEVPAD